MAAVLAGSFVLLSPPAAADDGKQTTDFGSVREHMNGVALQADGKIIAVGASGGNGSGAAFDFATARYTLVVQPASFDASRGTVPTGDFEAHTDAKTSNRTLAVFFTCIP